MKYTVGTAYYSHLVVWSRRGYMRRYAQYDYMAARTVVQY